MINPCALFEEYKYFDFQFPEPQYLGAKHKLVPWIAQHVPSGVRTAIDAFAGSHSVAYYFKQCGFRTVSCDFLSFNHQIGTSLIENRNVRLSDSDVSMLFSESANKDRYRLMEEQFANVFFEEDEARMPDHYRGNVEMLEHPIKRAMALAVMNRCLTRKVTMGHFAHTQALTYAANPERIKRNRSLVRPVKNIFMDILPSYNAAVFDNGEENKSRCENVLDALPTMPKADLIYFDPPYCDSHADYQGFYHVLETHTEYWREKRFVNRTHRYDPQRYSGFDKKADVVASLKRLFELSCDIPHWLMSYNDRSYPGIEQLMTMLSRWRRVSVETKTYQAGRGGKGSVAGSREILFVCSPPTVVSVGGVRQSDQDQ